MLNWTYFFTTATTGGRVLFQAIVLLKIENSKFWLILADLGYFVGNLGNFGVFLEAWIVWSWTNIDKYQVWNWTDLLVIVTKLYIGDTAPASHVSNVDEGD